MGDHCFLRLYFFAKDREIIERKCATRASDIVTRGATVCLEIEEANYALYTELNECASLGLTFHGWHGAGGNYPGGRFVATRGEYLEWPAIDTELIAWVDEGKAQVLADGEDITIYSLDVLRRFLAVEREVHALLPTFDPTENDEERTPAIAPPQDEPEEEPTPEPHDTFCLECRTSLGLCSLRSLGCYETASHASDLFCPECSTKILSVCDHGVRKDHFCQSCRDEYVIRKYNEERERAVIEAVRCADFRDTLPVHL